MIKAPVYYVNSRSIDPESQHLRDDTVLVAIDVKILPGERVRWFDTTKLRDFSGVLEANDNGGLCFTDRQKGFH